jgi:hypothetical protein
VQRGVGDVAQRARPGEHRQTVHRRPDRVLDAVAALRAEHAGHDQFVECGAKLAQRRAIRPGPVVWQAVSVLLRHGERGREQSRFLASELQVCGADGGQPQAGRGGITVRAVH